MIRLPELDSPGSMLDRLRQNDRPRAWSERLELARSLADWPPAQWSQPDAEQLLAHLAQDAKPEVRQAVANLLAIVPAGLFNGLRERLERDDNAFVRYSVERAVARRDSASRVARQVHFGVEEVSESLRTIERHHGRLAGRRAARLCDEYAQLLIGSMVHDLRSIMTHLKGNVAVVLRDTEAVRRVSARAVIRAQDSLESLERTVLDMEEFTAWINVTRRSERLVDLVTEATHVARSNLPAELGSDAAGVQIVMDVPETIRIEVCRHLLVSPLANIIKNAFEALAPAPHGGDRPCISFTASESDGLIDLAIRDNGMGFSPEEAAALRLFTPGRRNKSKPNSTGYGLPNAARKIRAHGGTIRFHSEEGKGTTVVVRLPIGGREVDHDNV